MAAPGLPTSVLVLCFCHDVLCYRFVTWLRTSKIRLELPAVKCHVDILWCSMMFRIFKLNNDANLLYTKYCFGVLPINFVLDLRKLCFLSKQRCHSISVHNVFYDVFGFYEFNRLCSVYSVCGQSRGYFSASVWDVFRALVFWLLYWLYCFFVLSVSTHCCVNKGYQCVT